MSTDDKPAPESAERQSIAHAVRRLRRCLDAGHADALDPADLRVVLDAVDELSTVCRELLDSKCPSLEEGFSFVDTLCLRQLEEKLAASPPPVAAPAAPPAPITDRDRLLAIARGCTDYGGGYSGAEYEIFQHGIGTVITALERAAEDFQTRTLERIVAAPAAPGTAPTGEK